MMEGTCTQQEYTATLRHCIDHVWPLFIFAEAVYDDGAPIGKYSLDPKFAPHGMDVVSQCAEVHICALFDTGDRALWNVQHLCHISLRELLSTAQFFQSHAL